MTEQEQAKFDSFMLGEQGTEQFRIISERDGVLIREQMIHDPFITSTTVIMISRWDLFKALFKRQFETRVCVSVRGSQGAERAIMTLDPVALERDTAEILESRRISRESSSVQLYECNVDNGS